MADIQKVRFNEPSLIRTTEPESQPVEANETPTVKRLDGEVVRLHQEKPIERKKRNLCGRQYSGLNPGKYTRYAVLCRELT